MTHIFDSWGFFTFLVALAHGAAAGRLQWAHLAFVGSPQRNLKENLPPQAKQGSLSFKQFSAFSSRSFSLSINPRLVIMSSTLGSFANYVDKILTFIDPRPTLGWQFESGQSYSYIMRKVWYHQIWIKTILGFIVLILIHALSCQRIWRMILSQTAWVAWAEMRLWAAGGWCIWAALKRTAESDGPL